MQYWRGLLASFSLMVLFAIPITAWTIPQNSIAGYLLAFAFASIPAAVWALLAQFFLSYIYFVDVSADGLGGGTFWGRRRFVQWNTVRSARRYTWLTMGLVYVRFVDGSPALWLPTKVKRQAAFLKDLQTAAPAGNPVLETFLEPSPTS